MQYNSTFTHASVLQCYECAEYHTVFAKALANRNVQSLPKILQKTPKYNTLKHNLMVALIGIKY